MQRSKKIQILKTASLSIFSIIVVLLLILGVKNSSFGTIKKYDSGGNSKRDILKSLSSTSMKVTITNDELANLGEFVFNISEDRKLIANISLRYKANYDDNSWFSSNDELKREIVIKSVILRDATIDIMLGSSLAAANSNKMRKELRDALNKNLSNGKVQEVYFNKFIIQ